MKRRLITLSTALIFMLCACSDSSDIADEIAATMQNLSSASYTAEITANFPSREQSFTLSYLYNKNGDDRVTVISPQEVAGVSLVISGDACELEFDGARLETGKLTDGGLSPFSALPMLISSWSGGNFSGTQKTRIYGKDAILVISNTTDENNTYEYRTWFSEETTLPLYSEIFADGERAIQCRFERAEQNS